ncbi:MAG: metallophosphoesterase [Sandaracinus sp.]|nr:metallophosphoesterase [Sandaracinus sp.]
MRRLLLTRGPQGAGKSTALRELDLAAWSLSADRVRETYAGPILRVDGHFGVPQHHDGVVWPTVTAIVEARMARGELLALDATHRDAASLAPWLTLAKIHRYRVLCLDFSAVPLERCLAQNAARPAPFAVPEPVLRDTWAACASNPLPEGLVSVPWSDEGTHRDVVRAFLEEPIVDLSTCRAITYVGDLQGTATPVRALFADGLRDDEHYVFVGDFCDRGRENGESLRWVIEASTRPNVTLLWGNHEDHLHRWARGWAPVNEEFALRTVPQLVEAGVTRDEVDALLDRMRDVFLHTWRGVRVMACHAGMSTVPSEPVRVSSHQWSRGTGPYEEPVDAQFDAQAPAGWFQVHGHRNHGDVPTIASPRSFNLEGRVEHGGVLRALRLEVGAEGLAPGGEAEGVEAIRFRPLAVGPRGERR